MNNKITPKQKATIIRNTVKTVLYCIAIVGMFLVLHSVLGDSSITLTLNWVKFLIGTILIAVVSKLFQWLFPVVRVTRKELDVAPKKK